MPAKAKNAGFSDYLKWIAIGFVLYIIWKAIKKDSENFGSTKEGFGSNVGNLEPKCDGEPVIKEQCSGDSGKPGGCISKSGAKLLPVLDPCFNMREICKQSILLEDHIFQESKSCQDCIRKHFLCIESLAEEAITLDSKNKYHFSDLKLPDKYRKIQKEFLAGNDVQSIAQQLRQIRKPLMAKYYESF